jgi:hypothetical protein
MENLSKNLILKTVFETNENLLKQLNYIRKTINKKEDLYSHSLLENIIKNPIGLNQIFNNNNIDFNKINYIIWGVPKTGNTSLFESFKKINQNTFFFHSIIELLYLDLNFINYTEKEIIDFIVNNNPKVFVIVSFRNPFMMTISRIYHDIKVYQVSLENNSSKIINKNMYINIVGKPIDYLYNQIFKEQFNIDFTSIKYNNDIGFGLLDYSNKLSFIFTRLEDFPKFELNINKIINLPSNFDFTIECINKNLNNEYISSKNIFDSECIDYIIDSNKILLNYYNYDIQTIRNNLI